MLEIAFINGGNFMLVNGEGDARTLLNLSEHIIGHSTTQVLFCQLTKFPSSIRWLLCEKGLADVRPKPHHDSVSAHVCSQLSLSVESVKGLHQTAIGSHDCALAIVVAVYTSVSRAAGNGGGSRREEDAATVRPPDAEVRFCQSINASLITDDHSTPHL
nr:hypothetical protein CFP56_03268 [Quercus suber]